MSDDAKIQDVARQLHDTLKPFGPEAAKSILDAAEQRLRGVSVSLNDSVTEAAQKAGVELSRHSPVHVHLTPAGGRGKIRLPNGVTPIDIAGYLDRHAPPGSPLNAKLRETFPHDAFAFAERLVRLEQSGLIAFGEAGTPPYPVIARVAREYFTTQDDFDFVGQLAAVMDCVVETFVDKPARMIQRIDVADGYIAVITPMIEKLVEKGAIWIDHAAGVARSDKTKAEISELILEFSLCDFCSGSPAPHILDVPDFAMPPIVGLAGKPDSTGGWAACDPCWTLYQQNKRAELLRRSIATSKVGKFGAAGIKAIHAEFWRSHDERLDAAGIAAAFVDYMHGTIETEKAPTVKDKRVESIQRLTGLTVDELAALERGDLSYQGVSKKLVAWQKTYGTDYKGARRLAEMIEQGTLRPAVVGTVPHWEQALTRKFEALQTLSTIVEHFNDARAGKASASVHLPEWTNLDDASSVREAIHKADGKLSIAGKGYETDIRLLRLADAYSFNAETVGAIFEAAKSIPHESPISSIETPSTGAGWFWFADPLPYACASNVSAHMYGLLWGWTNDDARNSAAIRFSAYTVAEFGDPLDVGKITPATKWYWPVEMSFHDMLAYNAAQYREQPDIDDRERAAGVGGDRESREAETMRIIGDVSLFFLSACVWFKQKILISAPGEIQPVKRHRLQTRYKLNEKPTVRVVALRASMREPAPRDPNAEPTTRQHEFRWMVKGHHRLQGVGPGRAIKKLVFVTPHSAGPADKPLRIREKVYAVVR